MNEKVKVSKRVYKRLKYIADNSIAIKNIDKLAEAIINRYINDYVINWSHKTKHRVEILNKDRSINKLIKHGSIGDDYANKVLKTMFKDRLASLYSINNDFFIKSHDKILFYSLSRFITVNEILTVLDYFDISYDITDLNLRFSYRHYYYESILEFTNNKIDNNKEEVND